MEHSTRLLRRRQVETLTGLKRSTIYEGMARGHFPKPIRLGPRTVAWLASEIDGWIAARIAESRPVATTEAKP
jgi:prophage regulatory protein